MNFIKRNFRYILLINILLIVAAIIVLNKDLPSSSEINKMAFDSIKLYKFEGEVIKKFVDKKNHNHSTLILKNKYGEQNVILTRDKSNLFDFVQIGDSISKEYGYLNVYVIRDNKVHEIILDYKVKE